MKRKISMTLVLILAAGLFVGAVAQTPQERLQQLIGTWKATESSFTDPPQGISKVVAAADGHAMYSTLTQGSDDTYYEANALWGYSETTKQVKVFEMNTLGFAGTHVGYFDDSGALILEFRDPETNELLQHRIMTWTLDI